MRPQVQAQVITALGDDAPGHDVEAIVDALVHEHEIDDIEDMDHDEFWALVAQCAHTDTTIAEVRALAEAVLSGRDRGRHDPVPEDTAVGLAGAAMTLVERYERLLRD